MRHTLYIAVMLSLTTLFAACSSLNSPSEHHRSLCATLKSQLLFSGGTSDTRRANIENSELLRAQQMYDKNNC